jgi:hypothetical protein
MQSSLRFEPAISGVEAKPLIRDRRNWIASAAASGLTTLALLLMWRRAAGAIHDPLPGSGLFLIAFLLSAIAAAAHSTGKQPTGKTRARLVANIALSVALLAVAAAISLPGTSAAGLIFLWAILLAEEAWSWRTRSIRLLQRLRQPAVVREGETPAEPPEKGDRCILCEAPSGPFRQNAPVPFFRRQEPRPPTADKIALETEDSALPEGVTQQLTRSTAADGAEELAGWLRVPFAVGQRTQNVHLAFCPPFAHTPELSVEQADGPSTRIKIAQVLPYGARLELKLHAAEEMPSAVVLEFSAVLDGRQVV